MYGRYGAGGRAAGRTADAERAVAAVDAGGGDTDGAGPAARRRGAAGWC